MTSVEQDRAASPENGGVRRVVAALIGATIEWYDFFLYGVVAGIVLNKLYFPASDPLISTLLAYATFAVGFIARPLGGIVFGHFGDRIGRKSMLVMTLMLMGVSTFLIGLLPTYAQIGAGAAPAPSHRAGHRARRRMGRRRPHGLRVCAARTPRPLREHPARWAAAR